MQPRQQDILIDIMPKALISPPLADDARTFQIRNATNRLEYAGNTFLIDPWLMPKHQFSFIDIPGRPYHVPDEMKEHLPMPFYDLPMPMEAILAERNVTNYDMPKAGQSLMY